MTAIEKSIVFLFEMLLAVCAACRGISCCGPSWPPGFELIAGNSYFTACRQRNKHGPQWGRP
jgi:hypothetical protein